MSTYLLKRLGVSVEQAFQWADPTLTSTIAQEIKDTVRAKYEEETWLTVAKPLNDQLRESQKAALIAACLFMTGYTDSNQLLEYFLIDVNMGACMMTSRLKQANASVQLFVQRCLMNLEPDLSPEALDDEEWRQSRKWYRVREAAKRIFLYPENWTLPDLRDDKTPFFKELESELLQNDLTDENVEKGLLNYLKKVDDTARLEICAHYWEGEADGRETGDGILHVFGRTPNKSHTYYYRRWLELYETWTPWEQLNITIDPPPPGDNDENKSGNNDGIHLLPVVFNRRLYLFWPVFNKIQDKESEPLPEGMPERTCWEIQIAWSEYWQNRWTSPAEVSSDVIISRPYSPKKEILKEDPPDIQESDEENKDFIEIERRPGISSRWTQAPRVYETITEEKRGCKRIMTVIVKSLLRYHLPPPRKHFLRVEKNGNTISIRILTSYVLDKEFIYTEQVKKEQIFDIVYEKTNEHYPIVFSVLDVVSSPFEVVELQVGQEVEIEISFGGRKKVKVIAVTAEGYGVALGDIKQEGERKPVDSRVISETEVERKILSTEERPVSINPYQFSHCDSFQFGKCGTQLEVTSEVPLIFVSELTFDVIQHFMLDSQNHFMSYISSPSAKNFSIQFSPFFFTTIVEVLGKPSDTYKALFPSQRPFPFFHNSPYYPFFYQDRQHVYCVRPVTNTTFIVQAPDKTPIPDYQEKGNQIPEKTLAEITGIGHQMYEMYKSLIEEIIFEKPGTEEVLGQTLLSALPPSRALQPLSNPAIMPLAGVGAGLMGLLMPILNASTLTTKSLDPDANQPIFLGAPLTSWITNWLSGLEGWSFYFEEIEQLKFEIHYHPYICDLIKALNSKGIPGLLNFDLQQDLAAMDDAGTAFKKYAPTKIVHPAYPAETIDFDPHGAYSIYNWELFFHAPLLIATRLTQDRRFADAQQWFHYIFNPTDSSSADPQTPWTRYWKILPFTTTERERIQELLEALSYQGDDFTKKKRRQDLEKLVSAWEDDPFKPHLVARTRLIAYQKTVVMKYIDNLIQWGDQLFRQDTIESINEATQLYILAYNILGPRPQEVPARGKVQPETYDSLKSKGLDSLANALVPLEEEFPFSSTELSSPVLHTIFNALFTLRGSRPLPYGRDLSTSGIDGYKSEIVNAVPSVIPYFSLTPPVEENQVQTLYFCVPQNDTLLGYWDTVADRLFKIRHCMNIEGVVRELPLYEPRIDPALLVQAAAKGIDIASVLNDRYAPLPYYRFSYMVQKAQELCAEVKAFGAALLSALEKKDAEALASLRADQEKALLNLQREVRVQQQKDAKANKEALDKSQVVVNTRKAFYEALKRERDENIPYPQEAAQLSEFQTAIQKAKELHDKEQTTANVSRWMPDTSISKGFIGQGGVYYAFSPTLGRGNYIAFMDASIKGLAWEVTAHTLNKEMAALSGLWNRRADEWEFQYNLAEKELDQIDQQITAADIRIAIAQQELANHDQQIENSTAVKEFLQDKYTNEALYTWMIGELSAVYYQTYDLAYTFARKAEQAYRFERGLTNSNFIQFGHWDSFRKGLLAGEKLSHDLKRLELAYLDQNKRDYEITKHISLLTHDPIALITLKETGLCDVELPEALFDTDYPGHYMRRIKSVSLTIPCVTGPYTSINCTLTLLRNDIRTQSIAGKSYARDIDNDDARFLTNFAATQSIATSTAQNDSGLFELNFRDERYLPFEGAGAISRWRIDMPKDCNAFDFNTISDVVLKLNYTARDGGEPLRSAAREYTKDLIKGTEDKPCIRLFSLKHEFPTDWHRFLHPNNPAPGGTITHQIALKLDKERFPFLLRSQSIKMKRLILFLNLKQGFTYDDQPELMLHINDSTGLAFVTAGSPAQGVPFVQMEFSEAILIPTDLALRVDEDDLLKPETIDDMFLICQYLIPTNG
jgi:hypothetical protein